MVLQDLSLVNGRIAGFAGGLYLCHAVVSMERVVLRNNR